MLWIYREKSFCFNSEFHIKSKLGSFRSMQDTSTMTNGSFSGSHILRSNRGDFMKHYYDYTSTLFSDGRAGDYLNELFLNAAKNGDFERVQNFLARSSRNMVINVDVKDKQTGHTAIMLAAINHHSKVVWLLLNYGADITLCNNRGQSVLDLASDSMRPLLLGSVARQGFSSRHLLQAAWQGNFQQVKKLLSSKANLDVNCTNADGLTPLLLVTRDLNLFQKIENAVMENGYHPVEVVKELLEHNADIVAKDSEGKRPLHFAVHGKGSHAKDVVDVLIKNSGGAIDVPDGLSNSPLHCASKADNQPVLLALIQGGADINIKGHIGRTPLHVAASHGHERSSGTLLDHGASVTITDDNGLSPVDVAKGGRVQMVLTEAWAEQTKGSLVKTKRIFSAPTNHIEAESIQVEAEGKPKGAVRTNTAPPQGVAKRMRKRSKSSLGNIYTIDERAKLAPTRKGSDVRMPKIPSEQKLDTIEGSSLNSSLVGKEKSGKQALGLSQREKQQPVSLPSLSVLNIQLSCVRNLKGDTQLLRSKMAAAQQPSPPRHRLRHRLSSPVLSYPRKLSPPTPYENERLRSLSTSQVSDVLPPSKLAIPSRVPPLDFHRALTPELRSMASPDLTQEKLSLVQEVIDLDLLTKRGDKTKSLSSVLAPEVKEVTPPRPSSVGAVESSSRIEDNQGPLENTEQFNKTLTFDSITKPTFWIPISDDKNIDDGKVFTSAKEQDTKSSGTSFYIDLSNLEALASGQCSACGKSLPEGYELPKKVLQQIGEDPGTNRPIRDGTEDKILCESCQPRRRSSEEVFWIPFTDKEKSSVIKKTESEPRKKQTEPPALRRKSKDSSLDKSKLHTSDAVEKTDRSHSTNSDSNSLKTSATGAFENVGSELAVPFQLQPKGSTEHSSNLTGFDVSCVCDKSSGVCSCTIVKKDLPEPAVQPDKNIFLTEGSLSGAVGKIVKTRGEISPPMESTLLERLEDNCVSDAIDGAHLGFSKLQAKKQSKAVFTNVPQENGAKSNIKTGWSNSKQVDPVSFKSDDTSRRQEVLSEAEEGSDVVSEKRELCPLREAWASPRKEEPVSSSVTVWNPFPSPPPPEDRSAVRAPIGPVNDRIFAKRKGTNGKTRGKKAAVKSSNGSKDAKPKSKVKSQRQSSKKGKKNTKGKTKSGVKMITVHQREASEELGLRTISDGGGSDMPEDAPCPPSVSLHSLSVLSRPFHFRSLRDKYSILSPILESPRSEPRTIDAPQSVREDKATEEQNQDAADNPLEAVTDAMESEKDDDTIDLDVVDGGVIGKLFGMCIPRLQLSKSDTDSDVESDLPIVSQDDVSDDQQSKATGRVDADKAENKDNLIDGRENSPQHLVHDEADDEIEEIMQSQLAQGERSNSGQCDTDSNPRNQAVTQDMFTDVTSDAGSEVREENDKSSVISLTYLTPFQQNSSREVFPNEETRLGLISADDEFCSPSSPSRASSAMTIDNEEYSDTDSSYQSCGSTSPRPLSSASSFNSSDTYFSSPRDSLGAVTPTPERDAGSENSVEIEYYKRMLSREEDTVRSSSESTLRPQSDTSFDSPGTSPQESADSFSSTTLVRSRLSATSRSKCSSSCEDEIVWKKGNILGKGAFGTVFCGLTNTGEMIAVKQVELNHSNIEEAEKQYEKLQEEVSLLKSLHHENIVRFIGTCFDGGVVNIFMEYVPGGSIASILARFGCLYESVFCRYTKQLLSGVSYLHGNNVIHRDIKGANILVMPSGVLKLIDFGCAKRLCLNLSMSKSNILRSMKGTPYWMAPEVIRETGHGRKSDIWSVGCTVYEMATGKPPWSDMPPMAAIFAIGSGSLALPELSENVSTKARDFVSKCLTRDPDLRPSADELHQHPFLKDPL